MKIFLIFVNGRNYLQSYLGGKFVLGLKMFPVCFWRLESREIPRLMFLNFYNIKSNNGAWIRDYGKNQTSRFCIFENCENTEKQHFPKRMGRVVFYYEKGRFLLRNWGELSYLRLGKMWLFFVHKGWALAQNKKTIYSP